MSERIKAATSNSISAILEMMAEFNAIDNYSFNMESTRKNLRYFLEHPELGQLWIAFSEEEIAGYLVLTYGFSFEHQGKDAFIDELFIKKAYRGKGYGERLIRFANDKAKKLGVNSIHLEVESENEAGRKLYRKVGFENSKRLLLTKKLG